jgi:hypothetical protein
MILLHLNIVHLVNDLIFLLIAKVKKVDLIYLQKNWRQ